MESIRDIIRKKYTMDRELTAWRWEVQQLEAEVPRKIYELREANVALTEYEGSLRSFLDKLSGKQQENQEIRSKAVREAKAALEASRWQLSSAQNALAALEEEAKALPTREELFETYPDMEYLKRQDALLCADRAVKLLRENEKYLMEARDWAENRNADFKPLGTQYDKSLALQKGADCAREICRLLGRIGEDGYVVDIHPYFQVPDGFIAGAARQYGQQDRINYALKAVHTALGIAQELILQLAEA